MEGELKKIKKLYGENFAKLCRSLFPTILQEENKLLSLLLSKFEPSRSLYDDLIRLEKVYDFKYFIFYHAGVKPAEIVDIKEKPDKLMARAGYSLYRCKNQREINRFKKFYAEDEQLCSFDDESRASTHHVFFAVKKGAEKLKRENFRKPRREDEYGTSVISIQFDKYDGELSIKNRYNHAVDNPDATFYNDLENIVPGLTSSFAKYYGLTSDVDYSRYSKLKLDGYVIGDNGKQYKVNQSVYCIAFCENNIIVKDGEVIEYDKDRYELVDRYLIDKSKKTIECLAGNDSFVDVFKNIEKIEVEKLETGDRKIIITFDGEKQAFITVNKNNAIVGYENEYVTEVGDHFMKRNNQLVELKIPNVTKIGNDCLHYNETLKEINMPNVRKIGNGFCCKNEAVTKLDMPMLDAVGDSFMTSNKKIDAISMPKLKTIGDRFLGSNKALETISLPSAVLIGHDFVQANNKITSVSLPNVVEIGSSFLMYDQKITEISLPKVKSIGGCFMRHANHIKFIAMPELEIVGEGFLHDNTELTELILPKIRSIGNSALSNNKKITEVLLPNVQNIGNMFLSGNACTTKMYAPNLAVVGSSFMASNRVLTEISFPKLEYIDSGFFRDNKELTHADIQKIKNKKFLTSHIEQLLENMQSKDSE